MKICAALFFAVTIAAAQSPQVPHKIDFAGMTLTVRDDARREIQKDVDALTQSPKHFAIKVERARMYFPLIEKVFEEENIPDDFKYLVLQESALIADAVSVSNAVGFWQFKDFTAMEMGLRVDKEIDERMNIVSASRGAARYIKKNNFYFNNWLYALQAYQMGAGAVLKTAPSNESGARHMEITSTTYWYVKKYLAHKIAFEDAVKGSARVRLIVYENKNAKTLTDLAKEVSVDENELKAHNKWARSGFIPDDRLYTVIIPVSGSENNLRLPAAVASPRAQAFASKNTTPTEKTKINGLPVIVAAVGENPTSLASRAGIALADFLKWNDISINDPVTPGQPYFLSKKRIRGAEAYHKVLPGENLWTVSQQFGVQLKKLKKYNRLQTSEAIKVGETLWLSARRPKEAPNATSSKEVAEVDNNQSFAWEANAETTPTLVSTSNANPVAIVPEPVSKSVMGDSLKTLPVKLRIDLPKKDSTFTIQVKKTEHVVQAGETLYAIAHQYEIGVMDLVHWNNLNLQEGIKPGQVLKLYDSQALIATIEVVPNEVIHEVKSSDTLYSVARKYGVTIKELMEWNGKKDFNVTVGEKIKILRR